MLIFLYLISFIFLAWIYSGYIIFLCLLPQKKKDHRVKPLTLPTVEIIIPMFNEEGFIESKIKNLLRLDYPPEKLKLTFVDGGSTDNTVKKVKEMSLKNKRIHLIPTNLRNKIRQINKVLDGVKADIVCISDVDTDLASNAIRVMIQEFNSNQQVAVVGAHTVPQSTIPIDQAHWQKQNEMRVLESKTASSSSVVANCYAFKRELLDQFPENVIADDVYVVFLAQSKGFQVVYTKKHLALELRSPQTIKAFSQHKFRKAHANITETLRFLPASLQGSWHWKVVYFTKFLQVIGAPFISLSFLTLSAYLLNFSPLPIAGIFLLLIMVTIASFLLQDHPQKSNHSTSPHLVTTLFSFAYVNLILFFSLLRYPTYKQTASYRKIQ